jgi:hypothetical protein
VVANLADMEGIDDDDHWSDTESEADGSLGTPLTSRAYQLEMFEHSMKGNIIAVVCGPNQAVVSAEFS